MDVIAVLILAADPLARAGLALLLAGEERLSLVGQISQPAELAEFAAQQPDVLLWDLGWDPPAPLPDLADYEGPILALLPDGEQAVAAWTAGARGLMRRDSEADELAVALAAVAAGLIVMQPGLDQTLLSWTVSEAEPGAEALTAREHEVLQLLAEGVTNRVIGQRLQISEHTVKFHVNAIMGKLGAQSRTEAVVRATRMGLIPL